MPINPGEQGQTAVLEDTELEKSWMVILFNDDFHSFDEVITQLQKATGCSLEMAEHIAVTAHNDGEAIAFTGDREKCEIVANILEEIKLRTELRQE